MLSIKSHGARPKDDLIELWRRIVFNMAVSNSDDHLRNHGFLLKKQGWVLSPLYDVNPVPYGDGLALNVDANNNSIDIELAIETAVKFGIAKDIARKLALDIVSKVDTNWEKLASIHGIRHRQVEEMRPAFSICKGHL